MKVYIMSGFVGLLVLLNSAFSQPLNNKIYRYPEKTINLSGIEIQYVEQGKQEGIPVILLHGFTDSWRSFETVLPYLSPELHVFAITQRGHGNSTKPVQGYDPENFADDIAAFIIEMKLGPVYIAGHSMGGLVAQQFALKYPNMLKGLILAGTDANFQDNPGLPEFHSAIMELQDPIDPGYAYDFQKSTCANPVDSAYFALLVLETLKVPARVWKSVIVGIMNINFQPRLAEINCPVLIVWGDQDLICPYEGQEYLYKGIRNTKLLIYDGGGHALHWEQPERFAKDVAEFVLHTLFYQHYLFTQSRKESSMPRRIKPTTLRDFGPLREQTARGE